MCRTPAVITARAVSACGWPAAASRTAPLTARPTQSATPPRTAACPTTSTAPAITSDETETRPPEVEHPAAAPLEADEHPEQAFAGKKRWQIVAGHCAVVCFGIVVIAGGQYNNTQSKNRP